MQEWILPALGAFLSWSFCSFVPKVTTKYISPRSAMVYQGIGGLLVTIVVLYALKFRPDAHPRGVALALTTGVIGIFGALCFLWAVNKGPVALVVTFTALSPVLTIFLAMALLNEPVTPRQGLGILLGLGAMALVAT